MPYSLRSKNRNTSAPLDKLKKVATPKKTKIAKGASPKKAKAPLKKESVAIIRPSLPISDAKQRLIKELSNLTGKPSEVKEKSHQKKKLILHNIDFSSSGKFQKKTRLDGKQLSKIVLRKVRQLDPNIKPSIVKARSTSMPSILAIKTEILKKAVLKEIKKGAKAAAKSPIKSPLKGR